ncbi:hypothetical protein Tco_0171308 [Tanacetum coccineum]
MVSSSSSTPIQLNVHHSEVFMGTPLIYAGVTRVYYVVPGKDLHDGFRALKSYSDKQICSKYAMRFKSEINLYLDHFNSQISHYVGDDLSDDEESTNEEGASKVKDDNDVSSDDDYEISYYSDDESDTASLDHLSKGEDEVVDARRKKGVVTPTFNDIFLTELCDSYDWDKYVENEVHFEDE